MSKPSRKFKSIYIEVFFFHFFCRCCDCHFISHYSLNAHTRTQIHYFVSKKQTSCTISSSVLSFKKTLLFSVCVNLCLFMGFFFVNWDFLASPYYSIFVSSISKLIWHFIHENKKKTEKKVKILTTILIDNQWCISFWKKII